MTFTPMPKGGVGDSQVKTEGGREAGLGEDEGHSKQGERDKGVGGDQRYG